MPRVNKGPSLVLYGPDNRHGARARKGFARFVWYLVWYSEGAKRERSTGFGLGEEAQAQGFLADFINGQQRSPAAEERRGPRGPDSFTIADALTLYAENHAPSLRRADCVANAIIRLVPWWGDAPASAITGSACRRYSKERLITIREGKLERRRQAEERATIKGKTLAPGHDATASTATPRQELAILQAAINWCQAEGHLTQAPIVTLPERPPSRERWLTRSEVANLLWAARLDKGRLHLPLFVMLAVYTGARRDAILSLQWQPNTVGGWVDLDRGVIDFRITGTSKTNKRRSTVPIPRRLLTFLLLARKRTRQYVLEYRGNPIKSVKVGLSNSGHRAGIGHVHPHVLRHTAVTWLVRAGVPLWQVAGWVGMTPSMIEQVYGHHSPDQYEAVERAHR